MEHFSGHGSTEIALLGCDRADAGVLQRAWDMGIPSFLFNGAQLKDGTVLRELRGLGVDLVVLAGFLRLIPKEMIAAYPERIVNIHPALLPDFGGKGMHGIHVHKAVLLSGATKSGITIHYVNEQYDEGRHLFQARCPVLPDDTIESLARRVLSLEHEHYPRVVEDLVIRLEKGERTV